MDFIVKNTKLESDALFRIRYELRYLFFGFLLTASVSTFLIYILIFVIDVEKTNKYNSLLTLIFLAICTVISVILISAKIQKIEIQKFKAVLIGIIFWFIGEATYMFYQFVLNIAVPYPSIAEIFYFLGYGFIFYHVFKSFRIVNKNKSITKKSIIVVSLIVLSIPIVTTIHMLVDSNSTSQYLEILINILYYILDTLLLIPSIILIFKLPRNDPYFYHWLLFFISITLLTIADFGYTYTSTISDDLILKTEWLWNVIYAFSYLFLSSSLIWYYKLTQLLNNDLDFTLKEDEDTRSNLLLNDNNRQEFSGKMSFHENIYDLDRIKDLVMNFIDKSSKIDILCCSADWLKIKEVKEIIPLLDTRMNDSNVLIRILLPITALHNKNKDNSLISLINNPNSVMRLFEKRLFSDSMILIFDLQNIIVLDTKNNNAAYDYDDQQNKTEYFAFYTNKEESIYKYMAIFEKIWLLEKVTKCDIR